MKKISTRKIGLGLLAVILVIGFAFILLNEDGLIRYLRLKSELKTLNEQVDSVDMQNKNLQNDIDSLKNKIPAKIEKVAREKYHMIRKGEKVIKVQEK